MANHPNALQWKKSTRSNDSFECVEVAELPDGRLVRDSKLGDSSPVLTVPPAAFQALLDDVKTDRI